MKQPVRFQSTIWTTIRNTMKKDTIASRDFFHKYRPPVMNFIMNSGFSEHEAEDLAQDVFLEIIKDDVLKKADASKGKFRTFLLSITKNVIRNEMEKRRSKKRGGGDHLIALDNLETDKESTQVENEFNRLWVFNIIKIAFERLKQECKTKGQSYYDALEMYVKKDIDYKTIADTLDESVANIKYYIYQGRKRLKELIKEEISSYSSSEDEYEKELDYLSRFIEKI